MGHVIPVSEITTYRIECYKCSANTEYQHVAGQDFSPEWEFIESDEFPGISFLICDTCRWDLFDGDENPRENHGFELGWKIKKYFLPQFELLDY